MAAFADWISASRACMVLLAFSTVSMETDLEASSLL